MYEQCTDETSNLFPYLQTNDTGGPFSTTFLSQTEE